MDVSAIQMIGVIGAGTMGSGIAQVCAANGYQVRLIDVDQAALDRALASIRGSVEKLHSKEKLTDAQRDAALSQIATGLDLTDVGGAQLVIEAVSESLDVKRSVFRRLDELTAPDAILASNTSSISITEIAAATVDASSADEVAALARSMRADLVLNACDPRCNPGVFGELTLMTM